MQYASGPFDATFGVVKLNRLFRLDCLHTRFFMFCSSSLKLNASIVSNLTDLSICSYVFIEQNSDLQLASFTSAEGAAAAAAKNLHLDVDGFVKLDETRLSVDPLTALEWHWICATFQYCK